jgi:hypothetical protein
MTSIADGSVIVQTSSESVPSPPFCVWSWDIRQRREADGSLRVVYGASIHSYRPCSQREQCHKLFGIPESFAASLQLATA